jgi:N-acetylmuramoyl-L-alanine amidase
MIVALLAGLLLQVASPIAAVSVKSGTQVTSVPVVMLGGATMLRADQLAGALGGEVARADGDRWRLVMAGVDFRLTARSPFAMVAGEPVPLGAEVQVRSGVLYVPYALMTDVLPRLASGVVYDARRGELRRLTVPPRTRSASNGTTARPTPRALKRLVVVDAGHGGPDRGMSGPLGGGSFRIYEKDITLQVARAVRAELESRGVKVIMTRNRDTLIALDDRGRIANERGADLFLSIHVNAANPRWRQPAGARGFETYFLSEARTDDARRVEEMENEVVKYEMARDVKQDDPLSFIMRDMAQNEYLRESSELAAVVQAKLGTDHPGPSRGVKQAGFRVLVTAIMPAVLIEIGFGTNASEARWIAGATGQRTIAKSIAEATVAYLEQYERRLGAGGQ